MYPLLSSPEGPLPESSESPPVPPLGSFVITVRVSVTVSVSVSILVTVFVSGVTRIVRVIELIRVDVFAFAVCVLVTVVDEVFTTVTVKGPAWVPCVPSFVVAWPSKHVGSTVSNKAVAFVDAGEPVAQRLDDGGPEDGSPLGPSAEEQAIQVRPRIVGAIICQTRRRGIGKLLKLGRVPSH